MAPRAKAGAQHVLGAGVSQAWGLSEAYEQPGGSGGLQGLPLRARGQCVEGCVCSRRCPVVPCPGPGWDDNPLPVPTSVPVASTASGHDLRKYACGFPRPTSRRRRAAGSTRNVRPSGSERGTSLLLHPEPQRPRPNPEEGDCFVLLCVFWLREGNCRQEAAN